MIQTKLSPVGIDVSIQRFQVHLYSKLPFQNYGSYPRVYKNPKDGKLIPETYEGDRDYKEVLFDDTYDITSFFVVSDDRKYIENSNGYMQTTVSLIIQADIQSLFPSVDHRADEELNNLIQNISKSFPGKSMFQLEKVTTGVENVYKEFDKTDSFLDDMSEKYVVRFDYDVRYVPTCCDDCPTPSKLCKDAEYNIVNANQETLYAGFVSSGGELLQIIQNSTIRNTDGSWVGSVLAEGEHILYDLYNVDSDGTPVQSVAMIPFTCTRWDDGLEIVDQFDNPITPISIVGKTIKINI